MKPLLSIGPRTANCLTISVNHLTELLLDVVNLLSVGLNGLLVLLYHVRRSTASSLALLFLRRGDSLRGLQIYQPLQHLGLVFET